MRVVAILTAIGATGALAASGLTATALADPVGDFYKGKVLTVYVGYPPGGAFDTSARLLSQYLTKYLPGSPTTVTVNKPGAGSIVLVNELYNVLPQDGTAIGTFGRNAPLVEAMGTAETNYKSAEFNWLGTPASDVSVCAAWHASGITSADEFMSREVVVGALPRADSEIYANLLNNLMGARLKVVTGYSGAGELFLALERGEIQGRCGWSWSSASTERGWYEAKQITIPIQLGVEKIKELPDVPQALDYARDERSRQVFEFIASSQLIGRPYAAPPNVPADRVKALRAAFNEAMEDAGLKDDAAKQQFVIDPVSGERLQEIVEGMLATHPDIVEAAKSAITRGSE